MPKINGDEFDPKRDTGTLYHIYSGMPSDEAKRSFMMGLLGSGKNGPAMVSAVFNHIQSLNNPSTQAASSSSAPPYVSPEQSASSLNSAADAVSYVGGASPGFTRSSGGMKNIDYQNYDPSGLGGASLTRSSFQRNPIPSVSTFQRYSMPTPAAQDPGMGLTRGPAPESSSLTRPSMALPSYEGMGLTRGPAPEAEIPRLSGPDLQEPMAPIPQIPGMGLTRRPPPRIVLDETDSNY